MTSLLRTLLRFLARRILARYRPIIVAVTGNVGKTTTKDALCSVLQSKYRVRATAGNLNNELGVPLTIIGDFSDQYYRANNMAVFWSVVLWHAVVRIIRSTTYPDILILEYGADRPGDIASLVAAYPPSISVVTHVGETPVHVEFFRSAAHVADEKSKLVTSLPQQGVAVLSHDDPAVLAMQAVTRARVVTFGASEGASVRVLNILPRLDGVRPIGLTFDVQIQGRTTSVSIAGVLGVGIAKAAAAAISVADVVGISISDAVAALECMHLPAGRMRILEGIRHTTILDDTYNASPAAMRAAIDTVRTIPASRHVFVIGDMLELGAYSQQAHEEIGRHIADYADVLICVGPRAAIIADAAQARISSDRIHRAADAHEAAALIQQLLRTGDLILVKGSQGMRLERVVQEIMARPEQATKVLVRQSPSWLRK